MPLHYQAVNLLNVNAHANDKIFPARGATFFCSMRERSSVSCSLHNNAIVDNATLKMKIDSDDAHNTHEKVIYFPLRLQHP